MVLSIFYKETQNSCFGWPFSHKSHDERTGLIGRSINFKMALDDDVLTEILGRVDSKTLAKTACVSSQFYSISSKESLWEDACSLRWPSTQNPQLKHLISSSPGGFRKLYGNCFSVINDTDEALQSHYQHDGIVEPYNASDLMWVVDVQYDKKPIFSKIVWRIPYECNFPGWFLQSPFQTDIINLEDVMDADGDGLPTIMSVDEVGKEGEIWRQLIENTKVNWIVINKRTGAAANLSSWNPMAEQRQPTSRVKFVVRFGSCLLPAVDILLCNVVKCIVEMKCRVLSSGDQASLKMSEVSVRLEDMSGNDVNGSKGLKILDRALRYRRINGRNKVSDLQRKDLIEGINFEEVAVPTEAHPRNVWIISYIIACVLFYYLQSLLRAVIAKD